MMATLQVVPELRNYHVDLLTDDVAALLYFDEKYDLEQRTSRDERIRQVSVMGAVVEAFSSDCDTLDIFEPLWVRNLHKWAVIAFAWKIGHVMRRSRVVSYCMENNSISALVAGRGRNRRLVTWVFTRVLGLAMSIVYTRLAFASSGAAATYQRLRLSPRVRSQVFTSLPSPDPLAVTSGDRSGVVFVGRLEERKGIESLMRAWSVVEEQLPDARLDIIGDGPMAPEVRAWATTERRAFHSSMAHSLVKSLLLERSVLVLPSIRSGRWREQIGLPILEGLSAGCTIVASDETGLAEWLADQGHRVYDSSSSTGLVGALLAALNQPLQVREVVASLPSVPTRKTAVEWLRRA
ncbi:glycosyltransferase family 4 protein [Microbacterium ureisolvens]|uniref:Glycosyltransferase family 4 protein n=1 Tax=Microbacterium ureisolvens TaxID=2781186 RepID=A0ABS7I242_9MICO|nr:glycosyltransferase family 4 protein [Microbacterium ureisolvens]MBW9111732.1 glycosyltransferase family 4 protein [Microbacterium ureisolvens]